jgi:chaperonin cofactor prefoldin
MGHHPVRPDEYLNGSYFRPDLTAHLNEYRKAVSSLQVFGESQKAIEKAENEIGRLNQEMTTLKTAIGPLISHLEKEMVIMEKAKAFQGQESTESADWLRTRIEQLERELGELKKATQKT